VTVAAGRSDARVPLFPRYRVRPICRQAVSGDITVGDVTNLRDVRGSISVLADSLFTGLTMRDTYERRAVFETGRYPEIVFTIDSLVDVQRGDTIHATAVGTIAVHGGTKAVRVPVRVWQDPAGMRVRAQFAVPARTLTDEFMMSKVALSMGVIMKRWKTVHMGIDVILKPVD
jgi:polyisoprenoid-binding protein YceI